MASPFNQLTKKAQEAIQKAHDNAGTRGHTTVEATHLLLALVSQEDGVVPLILETLDIDVQELESELSDMLDNAGDDKEDFFTGERSSFMQLFPSQEFSRILETALSIARKNAGNTHCNRTSIFRHCFKSRNSKTHIKRLWDNASRGNDCTEKTKYK